MAFADSGVRTVLQGYLPVTITLTGAVVEGGLIGYSTGWKAADGSPTIAAVGVAAKTRAAAEECTMYQSALVNGFTGGTAGAALYLSDTAGYYSDTTGSYTQIVGKMVSATEAFIAPQSISASVGTIEDGTVAFAKLAELASARLIVGSALGVATAVDVTGDVTITNAGVTAIGSGVIVNADVNAAAAIAHSKLAAMTDGYILVGSGATVPTAVAMSGDVTIVNTGATTIGADKVTAAMLKNAGKLRTIRTSTLDIDTIGAATYDEVAIVPAGALEITEIRIVYDKEQSGTVAGGSYSVGTTAVTGTEVVNAQALENSKAVGYAKVCTLVEGTVAADTPVFVRFTGVAATQAGATHLEIDFYYTDPA